jgi:glycosyltransferase involved in cell wall biosynthesis
MSLYFKESPKYLELALNSIFTNTSLPEQVVLVLDGPIGHELNVVVEKYQKEYPSLEVYPQEKNQGLSTALNIGLEKCRNELVFRMDTDDLCYPTRFERMLKLYEENPELELAGSWATMMDENGNELKPMYSPCSQREIYAKVWTCPFIHPTVSFKKSTLKRVGSYNPNSGPRQDDYELWFRCVGGGLKCMNLNEPLVYYRFFKDSIFRNNVSVGWWRMKVGLRGSWKCKCSPVAYIGVWYPFIRSLMPKFVRQWMYKMLDIVNPRVK